MKVRGLVLAAYDGGSFRNLKTPVLNKEAALVLRYSEENARGLV